MRHYGIPEKFITIIRNAYTGAQSKSIHEGQLTEAFAIKTGVRQGSLLSPMLFLLAVDWIMNQATDGRRNGIQWTMFTQLDDLLAVDWIMNQATDGRRNGIQWTMFTQLDDLEFADDIALLFHNHQQMPDKLEQV
ncbi:Hypothetical predicted protein [Mytilus galloprovincialis]|uniref:Reverse transcriptase domain-containing protein n=1 Tax=Mytilus galloprovincialis TaxID=29158 RepID=A0A8B6GNQ3_MYTGA|nr:Hypothetical predicted protein [Mytilus galloprovincialis]